MVSSLWGKVLERTESGVDFGKGAGGFAEEDRGVGVGFFDGRVLFCEERSRRGFRSVVYVRRMILPPPP